MSSLECLHEIICAGGFPVKIVVPCEGTGYEVGSISIIKGARNLDNAKNSTIGR